MPCLLPSLDPQSAALNLERLILPSIDPGPFRSSVKHLDRMSAAFLASCPPPWPAPGLQLTPEIQYQSELWLPLAGIQAVFQRFYRAALTYPPLLASTPFATAASWAAVAAGFPRFLDGIVTPVALLESLLADADLRSRFLFWSFMPPRFYGRGSCRYQGQADFVGEWLEQRRQVGGTLRCLDAACGDGNATYGLARILLEHGLKPEKFNIEGWTIDPLESWAAAHASFPHDPGWERSFRRETVELFESGVTERIVFWARDLLKIPDGHLLSQVKTGFDLILCNGILGGPIVHQPGDMKRIVAGLTGLLAPGGMLLAADRFHGGWKKQIPADFLGDLFRMCGLKVIETGEGIGGQMNLK